MSSEAIKGRLQDAEKSAEKTASDLKSKALDASNDLKARTQDATNDLGSKAQDAISSIKGKTTTDPLGFVPNFSFTDYVRFFSAGALCATITHGAMTPVDVVKTRLQLEPKGSKLGMASMARSIVASEGAAGLMTGFGPTAVGYLIQGGSKFCGFEAFKRAGVLMAGSEAEAQKHRTLIYIGGASAAELIASTLLTPLEAARIRLVSQRGYASGLAGAMTRMASEGGFREFYAGYIPILLKQIPFTVAQFTVNEYSHEFVNNNISEESIKAYGKTGEVGVSLGCGLAAGIAAAIASHPADTLLSKINKGGGGSGGTLSRLAQLTKETGFMGLWAGLGTRIIMQGALICAQMAIYDQIKKGLGAPAGISIAKETNVD
ncbi:mitochondrial carrier [Meira miltonrushii]|uniref:Mitochondrial carrier n=1 Tax=Meira miltonrushii TaxID=1280837 RepID=A0A316VH58_9BASI|nr:mitochondrial carrier [Meira miltonrushii]PWN36584.1 mitochondrial carrier [Meira miltonrushii]